MTRQLAGRFLAVLVGVIWFFALIFGGQGLLLGPVAWLAAVLGRRWPIASASLLLAPGAVLAIAWLAAIVTGPDRAQAVVIAGILAIPAAVAAWLITSGRPHPARAPA